MIAGTRYAHDDADFKSLIQKVEYLLRSISISGSLGDVFPVLKKIAPALFENIKVLETMNEVKNFFRVSIIIHHYWMYQQLTKSCSDTLICI
jgi:hypothetical protein